jgi:hypothetical protein
MRISSLLSQIAKGAAMRAEKNLQATIPVIPNTAD